jgi:hypothetical protein
MLRQSRRAAVNSRAKTWDFDPQPILCEAKPFLSLRARFMVCDHLGAIHPMEWLRRLTFDSTPGSISLKARIILGRLGYEWEFPAWVLGPNET